MTKFRHRAPDSVGGIPCQLVQVPGLPRLIDGPLMQPLVSRASHASRGRSDGDGTLAVEEGLGGGRSSPGGPSRGSEMPPL